jgi:hypothetical protein
MPSILIEREEIVTSDTSDIEKIKVFERFSSSWVRLFWLMFQIMGAARIKAKGMDFTPKRW